jgi:hypothetical protein
MVVETMFKVCNIVGKTAAAGIQVEGFDSRITTVSAALKGIVGNRIHEVLLGWEEFYAGLSQHYRRQN